MVQINKYVFWCWIVITIVFIIAFFWSNHSNANLIIDLAKREGVVQQLNVQINKKDSALIMKSLSIDSLNNIISNTNHSSIPVIITKYEKSKNALTILNANADSAISYLSRRLSEKDSD